MRTIKFRAWDKNNQQWLRNTWFGHFLENDASIEAPDNVAVMQFTGLLDKNGKEIYEGDIVQNQAHANRVVKQTKYGEYKLFCGEHSNSFYKGWEAGTVWEVIGNIYENPELVNGK